MRFSLAHDELYGDHLANTLRQNLHLDGQEIQDLNLIIALLTRNVRGPWEVRVEKNKGGDVDGDRLAVEVRTIPLS